MCRSLYSLKISNFSEEEKRKKSNKEENVGLDKFLFHLLVVFDRVASEAILKIAPNGKNDQRTKKTKDLSWYRIVERIHGRGDGRRW